MRTYTKVSVHDTDEDLYAAMCNVGMEREGEGLRLVEIKTTTGVEITFFKSRTQPEGGE